MNVENIMKEVSSEFGKVMPLKIVDDAPSAYFDWESVTLPKSFLEWDDEMIKNVIMHEFGHLFFSPRNPDVGVVINYIASLFGYENPWLFTNILTDLIVDTTNMEVFGEEYLHFLERSIGNVKNRSKIINVMAGVYHEKARELGMETSLPYNSTGRKIYEILEKKDKDFYLRIIEIANILIQYSNFKMPIHFIVHIFSKNSKNPRKIAKALIKLKIGRDIIEGLGRKAGVKHGFLMNDPVLIEYRKMVMLAKYMELESSLDGFENEEKTNGLWNIGDKPEDLDPVTTLTTYGTILPGIYSIRSESSDNGNSIDGKNYKDSIIILDSSGSMRGDKFERAREASYVITKKIQDNGKKVGLIPFSGIVYRDFVVYPTTDSSKIINLLARIEPSGGTVLRGALELAMNMGRNFYIYILSDSIIFDVEEVKNILENFKGRCTFFLISDNERINRWFEKDGIKIVEISPDGIVKKAYEEVRR